MSRTGLILIVAFAALAGCRKNNQMDQPLQNDLSLAQQQNQAHLDSISAAERSDSLARGGVTSTRTEERTVRQRHAYSGGEAVTATSTTSHTQTVRNTKRDAVIGAAAGAAVGALSSRDRLKGGIIGAAAGGLLGGIIGNNVDVHKKKVP